jgi:hypothetical protein
MEEIAGQTYYTLKSVSVATLTAGAARASRDRRGRAKT